EQAAILGGQVTPTALPVADEHATAGLNGHAGAHGVPVAAARKVVPAAFQFETDPVVGRAGLVVQERGRFAAVVDGDVHGTVIVVVPHGHAPADMPLPEVRPGGRGDFLKRALAVAA